MAKVPLQIGDVVRNRTTGVHGTIVRIYSDLALTKGRAVKRAYIVNLPDKEVIWQEGEIEVQNSN